MTDATDQAAILQAILEELKGMAAASGEGGDSSSSLGGSRGTPEREGESIEDWNARRQAAAKKERESLEARKAAGEELGAVLEHQIEVLRDLEEQTFATVAQGNEYVRVQQELNAEVEAGVNKGKSLVASLLPINGVLGKMNKVLPTSAEEMRGFAGGVGKMVTSGAAFAGAADLIVTKLLSIALATADANAAMVKATGTATDYTAGIAQTRNELRQYGVDAARSGEANAALYEGMSSFTTLSTATKNELRGQAALLKELNVPLGSSAKMWDQATKSLGFNETQLAELNQTLQDTAQSLGKSTTVVFREFTSVAKELAFYGEDVVGVFQDLQKQSKATGLEVSQLVSISGKAFDTFDGAATKVGRLNAILGGPYLNSIDMLNATESERLEMLTETMDASGQVFSDMGKFEQLALADALGVDVDTARRMFGNLSAAEELEIKRQEEIKETAMRAQKQIDKLKNAFNSMFVALEPVITAITWFVDLLVNLMTGEGGWKMLRWALLLTAAFFLIVPALTAVGGAIASVGAAFVSMGGAASGAFAAIKNPLKAIKEGFKKRMGIDQMPGPELPEGGLPGTETSIPEPPAGDTTSRWEAFTEGIKELGEAVKGTWREMLAFGAAVLMIGGGIAAAALGLSKLVESFQVLAGGQILGAVLAIGLVMGGFVAILYAMIPAITALGIAGGAVAGPLIALGFAFLLMGGGIALAALGMAQLVKSFKGLNGKELIAAGIGLGIFSLAVYGLISAAAAATLAYPVIYALSVLLVALGAAAWLMGTGISIAAIGLTILVDQLLKIQSVLSSGAVMTPQVIAFTDALMGIGLAALGILATAAALYALVPAIGAFGLATKVIGLKKLEALTEFNKSATLTIDTVYKPDTNEPGREATEKRMDAAAAGKTEGGSFPWPSDERLSKAAQAKDSTISKPVVNFNKHSILVKIGERELYDVVMEVLKGPEFKEEIGLR